jgi:hypothetical protein
MGFNDKFALQTILNGPCLLWVSAVLVGRALGLAATDAAVIGAPGHLF